MEEDAPQRAFVFLGTSMKRINGMWPSPSCTRRWIPWTILMSPTPSTGVVHVALPPRAPGPVLEEVEPDEMMSPSLQ
uniref:Uncharacterized protein n=1 Tax=Arundo donax TaxID=35708 RepID=A0A0A9GQX3_ARUDO